MTKKRKTGSKESLREILQPFPLNKNPSSNLGDGGVSDFPDAVGLQKNVESYPLEEPFEWVYKSTLLQNSNLSEPNYVAFSDILSKEECELIIQESSNLDRQKSQFDWGASGEYSRNTDIYWYHPAEFSYSIFEKVSQLAARTNAEIFKYELYGNMRSMQIGKYQVGQGYDWHIDLGAGWASKRKLSFVFCYRVMKNMKAGSSNFLAIPTRSIT